MTGGTDCIGENDSVFDAAKLAELDVWVDAHLRRGQSPQGMVTGRDIVVEVLAQGKDPASRRAPSPAARKVVTIGADDPSTKALSTMKSHQVRRLPVSTGMTWSAS